MRAGGRSLFQTAAGARARPQRVVDGAEVLRDHSMRPRPRPPRSFEEGAVAAARGERDQALGHDVDQPEVLEDVLDHADRVVGSVEDEEWNANPLGDRSAKTT